MGFFGLTTWILLFSMFSSTHTVLFCGNVNKTGSPRLLPNFAAEVDAYLGEFRSLQCCAAGFDSILWLRQDGSAWTPINTDDVDSVYRSSEENQVLDITSTHLNDNTNFRCDLHKDGRVALSGVVKLNVHACRHSGRGPILTDPFPSNLTVKELGGDAIFACSINLPCTQSTSPEFYFFRWCIKNCQEPPTNPRYTFTKREPNPYVVTQVLHIRDISNEDLNTPFICQVDSPQMVGGQSSVMVMISRVLPAFPTWGKIVLSAVGLVIVLVIVICTVRYIWGPRMRLIINSCFPSFAPRPVSRQKYRYNAFIVHADHTFDQDAAHKLKQALSPHHRDVIIAGEIMGNLNRYNQMEKLSEKSALLIILLSSNLYDDGLCIRFVEDVINIRNGKDIFLIKLDDPEAHRPNQPHEVNRQESVPEIDGEASGEVPANTPNGDTGTGDRNNMFKRVGMKFPMQTTQHWKWKKFVCQVVNKIPKFFDVGDHGVGNREEQLLMEDTPSAPNTASPAINVDNRFDFNNIACNAACPSLINFDDSLEQMPVCSQELEPNRDRQSNQAADRNEVQDYSSNQQFFLDDSFDQNISQNRSADSSNFRLNINTANGMQANTPVSAGQTMLFSPVFTSGISIRRNPMAVGSGHQINQNSLSGESGYVNSPLDLCPSFATPSGQFMQQNGEQLFNSNLV